MQDPTAHITPQSHIQTAPYNPYSGNEALDIIMRRIYAEIKDHQNFGAHLTYAKFSFDFDLKVTLDAVETVTVKGRSTQSTRQVEMSAKVAGNSNPAPDTGRREVGLYVPKPTPTPEGLVDIPLGMGVNRP